MNTPTRIVYLGALPNHVTVGEVLNAIHHVPTPLESVRYFAEKNCCFLSFLDVASAISWRNSVPKLTVKGHPVRVGWAKETPVASVVYEAMTGAAAATRTLYLGRLPDSLLAELDEDSLKYVMMDFGMVESVRILREKRVAFVYYTSVAFAMRAVQEVKELDLFKEWADEIRVNYGKERCMNGVMTGSGVGVGFSAVASVAVSGNGNFVNGAGGMVGTFTSNNHETDEMGNRLAGLSIETDTIGVSGASIITSPPPGFSSAVPSNGTPTLVSPPPGLTLASQTLISNNNNPNNNNLNNNNPTQSTFEQQHQILVSQWSQAQAILFPNATSTSLNENGESLSSSSSSHNNNNNDENGSFYQVLAEASVKERKNRTIYLGNLSSETSIQDLCNAIRGGLVHNIKMIPEKNCAFVSFVEPASAALLYFVAAHRGLVIRGRRVKPGWGKEMALSTAVMAAVEQGATRNVYLGGIDDSITVDKIMQDFSPFGAIEMIHLIPDRNIGFLNFTNILHAVKAVETMKHHPDYVKLKMNYGKDRCAQPFKSIYPSAAGAGAVVSAATALSSTSPKKHLEEDNPSHGNEESLHNYDNDQQN